MQDQLVPENRPARFPSDGDADDVNAPVEDHSWFPATAVAMGLLGLFILQVVLAPVTIILSALAWHRSEGDAYARRLVRIGYCLGIADGIVWLILESVFSVRLIPF